MRKDDMRAAVRHVRVLGNSLVIVFMLAAIGRAQVIRGNINGTVKDESGGALPGVSITLKSPALQVPHLDSVSAVDGTYAFPDLPGGIYQITYQLAGFATVVREQVELTTGFAARIGVEMKVGALEES